MTILKKKLFKWLKIHDLIKFKELRNHNIDHSITKFVSIINDISIILIYILVIIVYWKKKMEKKCMFYDTNVSSLSLATAYDVFYTNTITVI